MPGCCHGAVTRRRTIGEIQGAVADTDNGATHRSPFALPSGNGLGATVVTQGVVRQKILSRTNAGVTNSPTGRPTSPVTGRAERATTTRS